MRNLDWGFAIYKLLWYNAAGNPTLHTPITRRSTDEDLDCF